MKKHYIEKFEKKHKIISFITLILLTIFITRLLVSITDPNIIIKGFEIHHFYSGLILLIIISIIMLFEKGNFKINLFILAISIGLILDELVFIGTKIRGPVEYNSTFSSVLTLIVFILLITEIIFYWMKKSR